MPDANEPLMLEEFVDVASVIPKIGKFARTSMPVNMRGLGRANGAMNIVAPFGRDVANGRVVVVAVCELWKLLVTVPVLIKRTPWFRATGSK